MKGLPFVLAFTAMTFLAWGAYGPLLHHGTASMGRDSLRAFVGFGIAYFFIAVLVQSSFCEHKVKRGSGRCRAPFTRWSLALLVRWARSASSWPCPMVACRFT